MILKQIHLGLVIFLIVMVSCQTSPDGQLQLTPELETYNKIERTSGEDIGQGRPIHLPGWAYGQLTKEGDIWGGGPVLFYLGREKLDYNGILQRTFNSETSHETETKSKTRSSITAEEENGGSEDIEES